jgi:hypothetical protein
MGTPDEGDHHPVPGHETPGPLVEAWARRGLDDSAYPPRVWIKIEVEIKIHEIGGSWLPPKVTSATLGLPLPFCSGQG